MFYHWIIFFVLLVIFINTLLNLRALRKPEDKGQIPNPAPLVSVLVPARNEESNIERCIESLRRQDYPNYEIIVLDDSSSDNTADIVKGIADKDSRVRLIHGEPLPSDWAGKPYACHQLAQQAKGSWFLFTDADTAHDSSMLRKVLSTAIGSNVALISGFPHQEYVSIWQKMAMPVFFYFLLLCGIPLWLIQRFPNSSYPIAIGQFMFFSAQEYRSIGGHESVKARVIEDVALGREIAAHRYRQLTLDLSSLVTCRMFQDFGTMWDGVNRWLQPVAAASFFGLILAFLAIVLVFLAPFILLAYGLLLTSPQVLITTQVAILLLIRYIVGKRFSQSLISTIFHPLGLMFMLAAATSAYYRNITGDSIPWKERMYDPRSSRVT